VKDLEELANHGLDDLFDYGAAFVVGNALGDG